MMLKLKSKAGGVVDLYNTIAEQLGFDHRVCNYDCTKIEVSADIEEDIRKCYEDQEEFAMIWLVYGPKMNKDLPTNTVKLTDGFIEEV